ncbi:MAG: hypothetical protein WD059_11355 [Balneolaceae bacterium]
MYKQLKRHTLFLLTGFGFLSCTQINLEEPDSRFLSNAIACETDSLCFSRVDSLLWKNETPDFKNVVWSEIPRADTIINFHEYSDAGEFSTIVVLDNYHVEQEGEYFLRLGSDDGFRIFVNGEEVAKRAVGRSLKPDSDWIKINLKKGKNTLLFQVNQKDGGWGLHYRIQEDLDFENLFTSKAFEIYRDLPDATILNDTAGFLKLKKDPRLYLDEYHTISFSWINPFNDLKLSEFAFPAKALPDSLHLPGQSQFPLLFDYQILDKEQKVVYEEIIPIFDSASAQKFAEKSRQILSGKMNNQEWEENLKLVFAHELGLKSKKSYSTRMKSEFLWDVLTKTGEIDYNIGGPRTRSFNGELARGYVPYRAEEISPKVLGLHVEFSDSVHHFLDGHPGSSHALMTGWNSYAQKFSVELLFPFTSETIDSFNTAATLRHFEEHQADSFHVVAWSKSSVTLLNELNSNSLPIHQAALISPWLIDAPTESFLIARNIKLQNPHINFHIWHGMDDTDVAEYILKNWIKTFREQSLHVRYTQVPHSTHWNYWKEPEEAFYQQLNTP